MFKLENPRLESRRHNVTKKIQKFEQADKDVQMKIFFSTLHNSHSFLLYKDNFKYQFFINAIHINEII